MELFTAIRIHQEDARSLSAFAKESFDSEAECSDDLHITLQYLGEQTDVNGILCRLTQAAFPPFELKFSRINTFSNMPECSNVIWHGITDAQGNLSRLHDILGEALTGIRYPVVRNYTPHISLSFTDQDVDIDSIRAFSSPLEGKPFTVESIELCEVLGESCLPKFRTIARFRLDESRERRTAQLLWINDFHGAVTEEDDNPGAAKLVASVKNYLKENPDTEVIFGGDNFFGEPVSDLFKGKPVADAMKALHGKASVIGNHDFDVDSAALAECASEGNFEYLAANIHCAGRKVFKGSMNLLIGGFRIGLLGLSTIEPLPGPDHPDVWEGFEITDGTEAAKEFLDSSGYDAVAAATHYGLREGKCGKFIGEEALGLLERFPGFDAVLTAHFHQKIQFSSGKTAVLQAGCKGRYFGVIRFTFNEKKQLLSTVPLVYEVSRSVEADERIQQLTDEYVEKAMPQLDRIVGYAREDIPHRNAEFRVPMSGTALTKIAAECMIKASGCPVSILYSGRVGFSGFKKGPVTLYDFQKQFPFRNDLVTLKLTGAQIRNILEAGFRTPEEGLPSPLAAAGIIFTVCPDRPAGRRIRDLNDTSGRAIGDSSEYDVVTENYLITDPFGIPFSAGTEIRLSEKNVYGLMLDYFRDHPVLRNELPANIVVERSK